MENPSIKVCYRFMAETGMMDHIAAHSIMVYRVALLLSDGLIDKGIRLNRKLVAASSLLHDITKTRGFKTGENHARTGEQLLGEKGFPGAGKIVGQHVRLKTYSFLGQPSEIEIVNYADKRILHDQLVTLAERMGYILTQYGSSPQLKRQLYDLWEKTKNLEVKLFSFLPFSPDELDQRFDNKKFQNDLSTYRQLNSVRPV